MSLIIQPEHCNQHRCHSDGFRYRTRLPVSEREAKKPSYSILSTIKKLCIGMDLSRSGLPIGMYNALSYVQREACYVQYAELLREANDMDDPVARMEYVAAFIISSLSDFVSESCCRQSHIGIVGETFECVRPDLGFRVVSEAVAYSPPANSTFAESVDINGNPDGVYRVTVSGDVEKASFQGRSVEVKLRKFWKVELPQHNEVFTVYSKNCSIMVSNFLKGVNNVKLRLNGKLEIFCHHNENNKTVYQSQLKCVLNFHPPSRGFDWFGGWNQNADPAFSDGYIEDTTNGNHLTSFYGNYFREYYSIPTKAWKEIGGRRVASNPQNPFDLQIPGQKLLWRKRHFAEAQLDYFSMTEFHMQLNDLSSEMTSKLPPTDSRFRKDLRLFENGLLGEAEDAKRVMEEHEMIVHKRRANEKHRNGELWKPLWFTATKNPYDPSFDVFSFKGHYWQRDWSKCPNIVGFSSAELAVALSEDEE